MTLIAYASYDDYVQAQTSANRRSLHRVWAIRENVIFLSGYVKALIPSPRFGLCHGTRRGSEQQWFRECLGCEVIGTEISETADQFPHTVRWDFHEVKPEWVGAVDFIYSNSFDHTYDPAKCLDAWMSCLKPGGLCFLEHSRAHALGATRRDPFCATLPEMLDLIASLGYTAREVIDAPVQGKRVDLRHIVIEAQR